MLITDMVGDILENILIRMEDSGVTETEYLWTKKVMQAFCGEQIGADFILAVNATDGFFYFREGYSHEDFTSIFDLSIENGYACVKFDDGPSEPTWSCVDGCSIVQRSEVEKEW